MNYHQFITSKPDVCGGEPVIRGTRVTVRTILAALAEGSSIEAIANDYPTLKAEDIRAVIAYAASAVEEDLPIPALPKVA